MEIAEFIEELKQEHQDYIYQMNQWLKQLKKEFSNEKVEKIIEFLDKEIQNHANKEEKNLNEDIEKKYTDFDSSAIEFAHDVIDEAIEDVKDYYKKYKENKISTEKVIKAIEKVFTMLRDHFMEEENFLFQIYIKKKRSGCNVINSL